MPTDLTPREQAAAVLGKLLEEGDEVSLDDIAAALDEAGLLIDPVDNAMYQNLKLGYMRCHYKDGQLRFQMTDMGKDYVSQMLIPELAKDDE